MTIRIVLLACACLLATPALAQHDLFGPPPEVLGSRFGVTYQHPSFDLPVDLTFLSGVYEFEAEFHVGADWRAVMGLPYLHWAADGYESENAVGNITVGARQVRADPRGGGSILLTATIPTASDEDMAALLLGGVADYHMLQKYSPNHMGLLAHVTTESYQPGGFLYGFEAGGNFLIPTADRVDSEFTLRYGGAFGLRGGSFDLRAGLQGVFVASADGVDLGDKFWTDFVARVGLTAGAFRPALALRLPLKTEIRDDLSSVVVVQLQVALP